MKIVVLARKCWIKGVTRTMGAFPRRWESAREPRESSWRVSGFSGVKEMMCWIRKKLRYKKERSSIVISLLCLGIWVEMQ